jgi:prepilin-type N-terminal cleavage/methylation domain-containing protein
MKSGTHRGFSLLELMITIALILVMASVSFVTLVPMMRRNHVDAAYGTTLMALRNTRHLAITQSHEYILTFNPGGFPAGTIEVQYQPPSVGGVFPPLQLVNTVSLPSDVSFAVQAGFPAATPDGFGTGATAIDFGYLPTGGAGGQSQVVFMPDGSARDTNGNYNSGVIYVTQPSSTIYSSKSVTVWGATGRIRGWRLDQVAGSPVWTQQ